MYKANWLLQINYNNNNTLFIKSNTAYRLIVRVIPLSFKENDQTNFYSVSFLRQQSKLPRLLLTMYKKNNTNCHN